MFNTIKDIKKLLYKRQNDIIFVWNTKKNKYVRGSLVLEKNMFLFRAFDKHHETQDVDDVCIFDLENNKEENLNFLNEAIVQNYSHEPCWFKQLTDKDPHFIFGHYFFETSDFFIFHLYSLGTLNTKEIAVTGHCLDLLKGNGKEIGLRRSDVKEIGFEFFIGSYQIKSQEINELLNEFLVVEFN